MNFKSLIALLLMLTCLFGTTAFAQEKVVTGKVTDSKDGTPLAGITIQVKGSKLASQTNADGSFKIKVDENATLVFSSIGYAKQEISASNSPLSVNLVQSNAALNEVVVVAYGTRKKTDLTGSVTAVSAKDFQQGNVNSSEQLLQGKVAGLQITNGGGQPGGGSTIRIRGQSSLSASSDPLIVIDGVPVAGNGLGNSAQNLLSTIDPNDIESMSVLKDASAAALYGSRASGGVIIITTKKGTKGKIKFNFNTKFSVGVVGKEEDVLTGDQMRSIVNADASATGINTYKNLLGTANTDWQKQIYQSALGYDNNLSASGMAGMIPFRVSLGYLNQSGVLKTDMFNRLTTSVNLSPKFFDDHLAVNVNFKYAHNNNRYADNGAVSAAVNFDPTQAVHQTNKFGGYYEWLTAGGIPIGTNGGSVQPNPLSMLELRNHTGNLDRYLGNVQLDYKLNFFPDLHVLVNVGMDNATNVEQDNQQTNLVSTYQSTFSGSKYHFLQGSKNTMADVSLFYAKDLKAINSKVDVLLLHGYQKFETDVFTNPTTGTARDNGKDTVISSDITYPTDKPTYAMESYLARVNFTFASYYLLTASLRSDASSRFAPGKRVGNFPAVAAAWKLKDQFFNNTSVVTDLKLRLGVGETGQQDIGQNYYYTPNYYKSTNAAAQYQFGNTFYGFLRPTVYNPDLTWESTTTYNAGLDFGFFKNRITGTIDAYDKKTKNLLYNVQVAPGSNFDVTEYKNIGQMESKGVEVVINTVPYKTKDLTWELGGNVTYNHTEITDLGGSIFQVGGISGGTGNTIGIYQKGYDPSSFLVYKQVYNNKTGAPLEGLYVDANRDGQINPADQYIYKKATPDFLFGFTTQVIYKKFSVGIAAHGSLGNYLYNNYNANHDYLKGNGGMQNPLTFIQNGSSNYLATKFNSPQWLSNYFIENASFFRLDNINFGYNVGKIINNKASLRLNANVQNVFVITKYSGLDPENSDSHGIDNNIYPRPRIFTLGLNLDF